jgi:hypothetical protein
MPDPALYVAYPLARIALIPAPVQLLRGLLKLHQEVAGEVLRLSLAPFFAPQLD